MASEFLGIIDGLGFSLQVVGGVFFGGWILLTVGT